MKTKADDLPIQFGKYLLVERIAQGGMAEIFKAKSYGVSGFEKTIVIKRILPQFSEEKDFVEMLIDEAKICAGLQHANIVQIFDLGRMEGRYFIAMEYVHGVDLVHTLLRLNKAKRRLPIELACFIISEALKGLDYAHRATDADGKPLNIIHRDFNPANILLSYQGYVKVGDFGIAKASARSSKTEAGGLKGKLGYLSPEQVNGEQVDPRSDVFGAGITFWEMLACKRLFASGTELDVLLKIKNAQITDIQSVAPEVPEALKSILEKSMKKSIDDRYRSAAEFKDAIDDFLFDSGIKITSTHLEAYLKHLFADRIEDEKQRTQVEKVEGTRAEPPNYWVRGPDMPPSGPLAFGELSEMISQGQLTLRSELLREGGQWRPVKEVPELAVQLSRLPTKEESDLDAVATYQGLIAEISFPKLFYRMAIAKQGGRLVLNRPGVQKEIYLRQGMPEFVKSNMLAERLGEYLVAKKVITEAQRDQAVQVMHGYSGRLGDTLIGLGILKPHELFEHLQNQVREKILEVFAWTSGSYKFFDGQTYQGEVMPLQVGNYALIVEGVRKYVPIEMLKNRFGANLLRKVERLENVYLSLDKLALSAREQRVVDSIDGKKTVRDFLVLGGTDHHEFEQAVYKILYILEELEMIRFAQ
jgi:eukaryotic-like serine/threonine-protein kinase